MPGEGEMVEERLLLEMFLTTSKHIPRGYTRTKHPKILTLFIHERWDCRISHFFSLLKLC